MKNINKIIRKVIYEVVNNQVDYSGPYANLAFIFKNLCTQMSARLKQNQSVKNQMNQNNGITINDIATVLETLKDQINNNLLNFGKEVEINIVDTGQLNEGQINELDPRTYASAAQKLQAKGGRDSNYRLNSKRGNNLANYAAQQFNKQYGNTNDELDMSYDSNDGYDVQGNSSFMKPNGEVKVDNKRQTINNIPQSTRNAYNVAQQMQNGNGQYVKGQGWK